MEIQIPLVLFIAFCALSAGILASQAILALTKRGDDVQMPSLIASFASLVIGGVAVLFHLAQPLHIFNGFGNPSSGITQELIAIVVVVIVMLVYFIMLRRSNKVPAWLAVVAIVAALALDIVCAHSYMMASRPAWNSVLQVLSVVGGSCAVGTAVVAAIAGAKKSEAAAFAGTLTMAGTVVGLVCAVAYIAALSSTSGSLASFGTYIDPTNPTAALFDASSATPFAPAIMPATCTAIIASIVSVVAAVVGRSKGNWAVWGAIAAIAAIIAIIALRVVFYMMGVSVYNFYGITG